MILPITTPFPPMEAQSVEELPTGAGWQYEPKWDGFRCLAFRDGKAIQLQAKSGKPLGRYFPDVVALVAGLAPKRFVLDGEIVVPAGDRLDFDALLQRIHPAASRVQKLATETPAFLVAFDLLVDEKGNSLVEAPLSARRRALEAFAAAHLGGGAGIRLSPATRSLTVARRWLTSPGGNLDGVIAKRLDAPYGAGERTAMQKIKRYKSADCIVGGFRYSEGKPVVGSLLLGLYDDDGLLHHVGFTSGLKAAERPALTQRLKALIAPPGFTGRAPGGPSRWSTERSAEWEPLKPKLVVEVIYDHVSGGRFRHGTRLHRWRPDKAPAQCTLEQITGGGASFRKLLKAR
ncbi:MAG: ATP-dependent DNA ligase [Gemmatimonadota bacterium]